MKNIALVQYTLNFLDRGQTEEEKNLLRKEANVRYR